MRRVHQVLVAVATGLGVLAAPVAASASPGHGSNRAELQRELDGVVTASAFGALAEVRDERGVWRGSSGVAVRGSSRPVPVESRFRAGSITKTFLATVVLQLVDEGSLQLDDPVEKWLPGLVPNGQNITVKQLLNHTSGLYDFLRTLTRPPEPGFLDYRWRTWTAEEQIRRALAHPPVFKIPGSQYSYSNTNYALLGEIVEKVTGESYGDQIERRVIRPLRLHGTEMPGTDPRIRGPHPHGYVPIKFADGDQMVDLTVINPSLFGAGGEIISTTKDLNRFFAALLDGTLLPKHLLEAMKTPGTEKKKYGLGLAWRDTPCGIRVYGNDGDALAYNAWSFSTEDGKRQVTLAFTPAFRNDPDDVAKAFVDKAICG